MNTNVMLYVSLLYPICIIVEGDVGNCEIQTNCMQCTQTTVLSTYMVTMNKIFSYLTFHVLSHVK